MSLDWQVDVASFFTGVGQYIAPRPAPIPAERVEMRTKLIEEESKELCDAIRDGDLVKTVDGICDLIYVALGAACESGVTIQPHWDEVQRTNMAKVGGPKDPNTGKQLKPPGWTPPDLRSILLHQGGRGIL